MTSPAPRVVLIVLAWLVGQAATGLSIGEPPATALQGSVCFFQPTKPQSTGKQPQTTKPAKPKKKPAKAAAAPRPAVLDFEVIDALGQPVREECQVSGRVPGAKQFLLRPPDTKAVLRPLHVKTGTASLQHEFEYEFAGAGRRKAATLSLKNECLYWLWADAAYGQWSDKDLQAFESVLSKLLVEVVDGGTSLEFLQFFPAKKERIKRIAAKPTTAGLSLKDVGPDWELRDGGCEGDWTAQPLAPTRLRFTRQSHSFILDLDCKDGQLAARWDLKTDEELAALQRRIVVLNTEIKKLRNMLERIPPTSFEAMQERGAIARKISEKEEQRDALAAQARDSHKTVDERAKLRISECIARVVLPNGVVLYEIGFGREPKKP